MATLVLQAAGSALGSAVAGPIGAAIGQAAGGLAGSLIDQQWLGAGSQPRRFVQGPRLKSLDGVTANEGAPIPRVYGRARLGGQIIWATRFEELVEFTRQGKAGGKSTKAKPQITITTNYSYFANLAVALCEGPISFIRRVWADGKLLDLTTVAMRAYMGGEGQGPDPLISARQGATPAYRGVAYVVFERLPLANYGNRLPQFTFEVVRVVDGVAQMIRGVDLIPGATEFGYQASPVSRSLGLGSTASENRTQLHAPTDLAASLDALQGACPNARSVALVATWFGDDLRAGACSCRPKVDRADKQTVGGEWSVAGLDRGSASVVSQHAGSAAYGGTPSDESIRAAIAALKARGLSVVFYPFLMMDVPAGNALPDPWTGAGSQAPYPWRGRITCHPAPGQAGTPDGTAAAASQIASFFGTASASHFTVSGSTIAYSGPAEWSYRRHILHSAALAKSAGGVDAFIIGSELVGLTRVRSAPGVYPAVAQLAALAAEVRALLGSGVKISYAADWSEYGAHVLAGGAEVRFPLDPLWANANIDFVGIDFYPPVADWRDGTDHADAEIAASGADVNYLRQRFASGEAYDWHYASPANRTNQIRTPITDGAYGKPWVFRAKDLKGWWENAHVERVGGVETAATAWAARGKSIWLTEVGCPAVDKGANSPNLFPDPKSAEGGYPPFSSGARDDLVQARFLEAAIRRFDPALPGFNAADNPVSPVYGGRMVDPARIHVWCWDARPFPAFPYTAGFGDGPNYVTGHWINGRIEGMAVDRLIAAICADHGLPAPQFEGADGFVDGYVIDRPMSARAAIEPIESLFSLDATTRAGKIVFSGRGAQATFSLTREDLAPGRKGAEIARMRAQETELPRSISVGFSDSENDYRRVAVSALRQTARSRREQSSETSAALRLAEAQKLADLVLRDAWIARDRAEFSLRPGLLEVEAGDVVLLEVEGEERRFQITRIVEGETRRCEARAIAPEIFGTQPAMAEIATRPAPPTPGPPSALVLDLPIDPGAPTPLAALALRADPWRGPYTLWRSADGASFDPVATIGRPTVLGETLSTLSPGPLWRWDKAGSVTIRIAGGAFSSVTDEAALAGANLIALRGLDGVWEIVSFASATLVSPGVWTASRLLRGLYGSEAAAARSLAPGAPVVVLDESLTPLFSGAEDVGASASFRVSPDGFDHADFGAAAFSAAAGSSALRPLAPVRARAKRGAGGVALSWIRRARTGGDNWDANEIPLSEEIEEYRVEVLGGGGASLRLLTASTPSLLYAAADEIADFGVAQASLSLRIAQVSRAAGAGRAFEGVVPVI
jgi:hypothetical protein